MNYLSPQIEALAKRGKSGEKSLIKKEYSCGIFQDYDDSIAKTKGGTL